MAHAGGNQSAQAEWQKELELLNLSPEQKKTLKRVTDALNHTCALQQGKLLCELHPILLPGVSIGEKLAGNDPRYKPWTACLKANLQGFSVSTAYNRKTGYREANDRYGELVVAAVITSPMATAVRPQPGLPMGKFTAAADKVMEGKDKDRLTADDTTKLVAEVITLVKKVKNASGKSDEEGLSKEAIRTRRIAEKQKQLFESVLKGYSALNNSQKLGLAAIRELWIDSETGLVALVSKALWINDKVEVNLPEELPNGYNALAEDPSDKTKSVVIEPPKPRSEIGHIAQTVRNKLETTKVTQRQASHSSPSLPAEPPGEPSIPTLPVQSHRDINELHEAIFTKHKAHPDWDDFDLADACGSSVTVVRQALMRFGRIGEKDKAS